MKKVLFTLASVMLLVASFSALMAKETHQELPRRTMAIVEESNSLFPSKLSAASTAGTTFYGVWDFSTGGSCDPEGWTSHDLNADPNEWWHVDNFAGLGGGTYGRLVALEGTKSLWCGARVDLANLAICGYAALPGYGNGWNQYWCGKSCLAPTGDIEISFLGTWDSEPDWDQGFIEYADDCGSTWSDAGWVFDGVAEDSFVVVTIPDSVRIGTNVQLRFHFAADGAWSDEDGLWDTDGAWIIDSLTVSDDLGTLVATEDFEGEAVDAQASDDWESCIGAGYGDFAALYQGLTVVQEDPCQTVLTCVWAFIDGSTYDYSCGGYPAQAAVPYTDPNGLFIYNSIQSPIFPYVSGAPEVKLRFNSYGDHDQENMIHYFWDVRSIVSGCPGGWESDGYVRYSPLATWGLVTYDLGPLLAPGATGIQVRFGVIDMCFVWCGVYGDGSCHSHGPMWDEVEVFAIESSGPTFAPQAGSLFNDNFATDGTLTGTVRIDMARDILSFNNPNQLAGDSLTIEAVDPVYGIKPDPYTSFGDAVYAFVGIYPQNQAGKSGAALSQDNFRFPVVDSLTSPEGDTWYMVRMDSVFNQPGRTGYAPDRYCVDLNDNLFTPGDTICYFIGGQSDDPGGSWKYYFSREIATDIEAGFAPSQTEDINVAFANRLEATCLPTQHLPGNGGDILYVDAADGRRAQPYFDTAFEQLGILDKVDRFDIYGSGGTALGEFGNRVQDLYAQLIPVYRKIIWSSGNLSSLTVGDGTGDPNKSDDFGILYTFLDQHSNNPGVYFSGDGIAEEWDEDLVGINAINLRGSYMNFNLVTADHQSIGLELNPLSIGTGGGPFDHIAGPDTLVAYGGCNLVRRLDVMTPSGLSQAAMNYNGNPAHGSSIYQSTPNSASSTARVILEGFDLFEVRDDRPSAVSDRVHHLYDIITWLQNTVSVPTDAKPARLSSTLAQNYPNPFNPSTTIEYSLRADAHVSLKIYNVAGQLVRTLVDGSRSGGLVHTAVWDGRTDAGQTVSSGVYFYKLVSDNFTKTRKMVLLK